MKIFWIGGPAAAGKTTVGRLLARKHGFVWYSLDAHLFDYEKRAAAAGLHVLGTGPGDFDRKPMILEDVEALGVRTPVVVEGAFVTPALAGVDGNAVWLMPSRAEQLTRLQHRNPGADNEGFVWGWNLVNSQLEGTAATMISVDGQTIPQTLAAVEAHFAGLIPARPSTADRPSLIRLGNRQLAGRPGSQTFDCECGRPSCTDFVQLTSEQSSTLLAVEPPSITSPQHSAPT
ncbi:MAG TPA: hypothetical protein VGL05_03205 [Kribbella sp.]